jgi:hypothetical protein
MQNLKKEIVRKVASLDLVHDIGLRRSEIKFVCAKLEQQKANFGTDEEWLAAIDSSVASYRHDPLLAEVRRTAVAVNQACPICGIAGDPITLMGGRSAYFCKSHKVVLPALAESV